MEILKNNTKIGVVNLRSFGKSVLTFGSSPLNDIVIPSSAVSQRQGLVLVAGNDIEIRDNPDSGCDLYFDGKAFLTKIVLPNTVISIKPCGKAAEEILLAFNE
ncbi:MAG: hypothetical protein LUH40_02700 [Clostridiales bacterium]|nr:hypothetical protein [Clostridiales bacterium]